MRKKITSTDHSKIGKGKSINSFQSIKPRKCLDDQSGDTGENPANLPEIRLFSDKTSS